MVEIAKHKEGGNLGDEREYPKTLQRYTRKGTRQAVSQIELAKRLP